LALEPLGTHKVGAYDLPSYLHLDLDPEELMMFFGINTVEMG